MADAPGRLLWAAPVLAACTLAWLVRELGMGIESTDEAYYLLHAIHADSIGIFFTPFHWVTGPMWSIAQGLAAFRVMGLVLCVGSALVLAEGVIRVAPAQPDRMGTWSLAASGALLYGSLLPFTPSYNLLASSFACLAMGWGLMALAGSRASAIAAGVALALATVVKFPAGLGAAVLLLAVWFAMAKRRDAMRLLLVAAGSLATLTLLVGANGGPSHALAQFRTGTEVLWAVQGDHSTAGRLLRSATDVGQMLQATLVAFGVPLAVMAAGVAMRRPWLELLGLAAVAAVVVAGGHLQGGYDRFGLQAQPLVALLAAMLVSGGLRPSMLPAVLAALPFAIAIGTSNPLHVQLLGGLAPWGVLGAIVALKQPLRWMGVLASLAFAATILAQVAGHSQQPYRMAPMAQQVVPIVVPVLGEIDVDPGTATRLQALHDAAARCGIRPGTPFVDLYNLPVAGLVLDAPPLVSPWMLDAHHAERVLRHAEPALLRRATLVVEDGAALPPQLADYRSTHRSCGRAGRYEVWAALP